MGPKITIDSATLMNKGLELIEAHHLFALPPDEIDVLVHPQSVVHGLVEFRDGSVVAQLGPPDMRVPIAHCLAWPERIDGPAHGSTSRRLRQLTFEDADLVRFPALALARQAMETGGGGADRPQRRRRGRGGRVYRRPHLVSGDRLAGRGDARGRGGARPLAEPDSIEAALAVDHVARRLAHDLLLNIAVKAS